VTDSLANYLAFIDDSGQKEYIDPYNRDNILRPDKLDRAFWLRNYFVIVALTVKREDIARINRAMVQLKLEAFGDTAVEVKSDWIRNPHPR